MLAVRTPPDRGARRVPSWSRESVCHAARSSVRTSREETMNRLLRGGPRCSVDRSRRAAPPYPRSESVHQARREELEQRVACRVAEGLVDPLIGTRRSSEEHDRREGFGTRQSATRYRVPQCRTGMPSTAVTTCRNSGHVSSAFGRLRRVVVPRTDPVLARHAEVRALALLTGRVAPTRPRSMVRGASWPSFPWI